MPQPRQPSPTKFQDLISKNPSGRYDLKTIQHQMLDAAHEVTLHASDGKEYTLLALVESAPELSSSILNSRSGIKTAILAGTNPLIDATQDLKEWKSDLGFFLAKHPLIPGESNREKADALKGFVQRITNAMIGALPPELLENMAKGNTPSPG